MFVTFEGGEGSGRSTLSCSVAAELQERGLEVMLTAEAGGTSLASAVRELLPSSEVGDAPYPGAEYALFQAYRAEHVRSVIWPAISSGTVVLYDRFSDSTFADQAENVSVDVALLLDLLFAYGGMRPDMTVILGVPIRVAMERVKRRGDQDRLDIRSEDFYERVASRYRAMAARDPGRFFLMDDEASSTVVADEVERRLELQGSRA